MPQPKDFHLEEYKLLKQQISSLIDRVSTIIQYVLAGVAAIYTWLLTHPSGSELRGSVGLWIPVVLSLFGVLMVINISTRIYDIREYLKLLDEYLHDPNGTLSYPGWEHFRARSTFAGFWEAVVIILLALVCASTFVLAMGWTPLVLLFSPRPPQ